jgi:hypothetical protein
MPGLNLGLGARGHVGISGAGSGYSSTQTPASATEMAYGPSYASGKPGGTKAALAPNDAFAVAFWWGVGSLGLLILIRHSLPA